MRVDPETLLMMARRSGITLYRRGGLLVVSSETGVPKIWAETLKRHKAELLPIVPGIATASTKPTPQAEEIQTGEIFDLFGPVPSQPDRKRQSSRQKNPS